jgi:thiosulfate dehydrogenase [quinone] large subunit
MTALQHRPPIARDLPVSTPSAGALTTPARYVFAAVRIGLGWTFLWAFLDKTFGWGYSTPAAGAWIDGGHPTAGFLGRSAKGPFMDMWHNAAGTWWADWLFMIGLAGIGVALMLGIAMRIAAAAGAALLIMMWSAVLPPENNPFMDDHLVYALVLVVLALTAAGRTLGFGRVWERIPFVVRFGFLK